MRAARALLPILCGLVVACSLVSNQLFSGAMPEPGAPRVLLPAARLTELASEAPSLQRYGEAPYWDPATADLDVCERALWRRVHWNGLHDELGGYLIQYFGVTRHGGQRVVMLGVCPAQANRYLAEAAI